MEAKLFQSLSLCVHHPTTIKRKNPFQILVLIRNTIISPITAVDILYVCRQTTAIVLSLLYYDREMVIFIRWFQLKILILFILHPGNIHSWVAVAVYF